MIWCCGPRSHATMSIGCPTRFSPANNRSYMASRSEWHAICTPPPESTCPVSAFIRHVDYFRVPRHSPSPDLVLGAENTSWPGGQGGQARPFLSYAALAD